MPTPIEVETATLRNLLWFAVNLAFLALFSHTALTQGGWLLKAIWTVFALIGLRDGLQVVLETARWAQAGRLTFAYDWDDAVPGRRLGLVLKSDRRSLARRQWDVRLACVAVRRQGWVKEETGVWAGEVEVLARERTLWGSRIDLAVSVPTLDLPAEEVEWQVTLTGHGGWRPLDLMFTVGIHEAPDVVAGPRS